MTQPVAEKSGMSPRRRGAIRLKARQFNLMTRILGCESDEARARLIDVSAKTIYRARRGLVGQELIIRTLITLGDHRDLLARYNIVPSFDELFEVVEVNAEQPVKAPEAARVDRYPGWCPAVVADSQLGRHK